MHAVLESPQQRYSRRQTSQRRDIGAIPAIKDEKRRQSCERDLKLFLETYFPESFSLGWSPSHELLINAIQRAIFEGLQQAIGFPRGSGKTTICQRAILWAVLYGHRVFPMLFGAEQGKAEQHMKALRHELMTNDRLLEDFPEIAYPFRCTEGIAQRANHQTCGGEPTDIELGADFIVFPSTKESIERGNAEAIIGIGTVTGAASRGPLIRGRRPDLALIDDPQTRKSAKSVTMCRERSDSINGDIMGMAGPGKNISALMTCTVIYRGDLADQHLNRKERPEWHGIRVKMVESMPSKMELWDQWSDAVRMCQENDLSLDQAHDFYRENRKQMDAGSETYWDDRIAPGYVSAIESAMYLYYRDASSFASEYQNEPLELDSDEGLPSVDTIRKQTHGCRRNVVPEKCEHLTAFVDVQKKLLFYVVVGWEPNFTGYVIDYGTWPDQKRAYFTKHDARITIGHKKRGASWDNCLRNALEELVLNDFGRTYKREDGVEMRISRGLIDANWGDSTDTVYSFLKANKLAPVWMPSHGRGITASQKALNDTKMGRRDRTKRGAHWRISKHEQYKIERVVFDSNFWKTFHAQRWATVPGDPGAIYLYDRRDHAMFADHLNAEYGVTVESKDRKVTEWHVKPGATDNDLLDGMVGNCVAASMLGCETQILAAMVPEKEKKRASITADNIGDFYG